MNSMHDQLYKNVETSLSSAFASMQRSLVDLQLQLQVKLYQMKEKQQGEIHCQYEFDDAVRKIVRSLDTFTAHADNLSHIKLTLARAVAIVSPDGNLAQLGAYQLEKERSYERSYERSNERSLDVNSELLGYHREEDHLLNLESRRIQNATCFVFYLPSSETNETLRDLFMPYGVVLNSYIIINKLTGKTRGYGFVDFAQPSEAQKAVQMLDKLPRQGKFLSVSIKM